MRAVNLRYELCDIRCDRKTVLGNPYAMQNNSHEERTRVIQLYRIYLWGILNGKTPMSGSREEFMRLFLSITEGKRLGCWCAPLPCHCDVLINARRWLNQETMHQEKA